jgi:hypothetical protein
MVVTGLVAVLALFTVGAHSQVLVAESSSVTVKAASDEDMPDAPQPNLPQERGASAGAQTYPQGIGPGPHGMGPGPLLAQTFHEKFMAYAVGTVGPRALFAPMIPAAIRMANPPRTYPDAWRQGMQAYGRNYGNQLATLTTYNTARFVVGAALHEDLRYHPSTSTNFFMRTGHALAFTLVDRSDDGHMRLAVANYAGLMAGSYVGMSYLPAGFNDVTHADQRLAIRFGSLAGGNLGQEFAPEIIRFAIKHHLPRPRIPIPEWWTREY